MAAGALAATVLVWAWLATPMEPGRPLAQGDFELAGSFRNGGPYPSIPALPPERPSLRAYGSWVDADNHAGSLKGPPFVPEGRRMAVFLAGYPNQPGNQLALERPDTGARVPLAVGREPGEAWRMVLFEVPVAWRGRAVRITGSAGSSWLALSEPFAPPAWEGAPAAFVAAGKMWLGLALRWLLFALPAGAAVAAAWRRGFDRAGLCTLGACATATAGYLALWVNLLSPTAGRVFGYTVPAASAAVLLWTWRRHPGRVSAVARAFRTPLALVPAAAALYLALGFLYGGFDSPMGTAAHRYFGWAADNELPYVYAAKIIGAPLAPGWENWNVYDRPPLATGLVLLAAPFGFGLPEYELTGALLQAFALAGIWAFLEAFGVAGRARRTALVVCAFSAFVLMNAVYVWPKLLPTAFLFAAAGLLFRPGFPRHRGEPYLAGAALGFAMLCHGGSVFPVLAMALAFVWRGRRARPALAAGVVAAAAGLAVMLPWNGYARLHDPTHVLVDWHMGGMLPPGVPKGASAFEVIRRGYVAVGPAGVLWNKLDNLRFQFVPGTGIARSWAVSANAGMKHTVDAVFSSTVWMVMVPLAVTIAGALVLRLSRGRTAAEAEAGRAAGVAGWLGIGALVLWCLMMFGPRMAVTDIYGSSAMATLPSGSFWPPLAVLVALALAAARLGRGAALAAMGLQMVVFLVIGTHRPYPPPGSAALFDMALPNAAMALSAALATGGVLAAARGVRP